MLSWGCWVLGEVYYKMILSLLKEVFHTHSFHGATEDSLMGCTSIHKGREVKEKRIERLLSHQFNFLHRSTLDIAFNRSRALARVEIKNLLGRCHYQTSLIYSFVSDGLLLENNRIVQKLNQAISSTSKALETKNALLPNVFASFLLHFSMVWMISGLALGGIYLYTHFDKDDSWGLFVRILMTVSFSIASLQYVLDRHYERKSFLFQTMRKIRQKIFRFHYIVFIEKKSKNQASPMDDKSDKAEGSVKFENIEHMKPSFSSANSFFKRVQLLMIRALLSYRKNQTKGLIAAIVFGIVTVVILGWYWVKLYLG